MAVINLNDIKLYRKTMIKSHSVYIGLPELGTKVINRLTGEQYITDKLNCFVVSGTTGEMVTESLEGISKKYVLANRKEIILDNLRELAVKANTGSTLIDWFKAISKPDKTSKWAVFIPSNYILNTIDGNGKSIIVNDSRFNHGYGDFVVCNTLAGKPNTRSLRVVNGLVFPNIYNMSSFKDLSSNILGNSTPKPRSFINI